MQLRRLVAVLSLGLAASGMFARDANADEATGAWSGVVEGRLNYYWETSTRVVVPTIKAEADSPGGFHFGAGYLIDAITSASIAQTGQTEVDALFTEYRHGVHAELGQAFDLRSSQLDVRVNGVYSTEDDYTSVVYGLESNLTFNDKATRVALGINRVQDDIDSNADPTFAGKLSGTTLGASVEQAINPVMSITLGYQFGYLEGYLGNAYRSALRGALPLRENPPGTRARHSATAHLAWYLPTTSTALHLLLGGYTDSWEIRAITPELRVYQEVGRDLLLQPHYRFYAQTKAWFQSDGPYPGTWTGPVTNDPKMAEFTTHTFGLSLDYRLGFLADTVFDFGKNLTIDITFDRYLSTSRYGNGIIGTAGGRLTF